MIVCVILGSRYRVTRVRRPFLVCVRERGPSGARWALTQQGRMMTSSIPSHKRPRLSEEGGKLQSLLQQSLHLSAATTICLLEYKVTLPVL